MRILVVLFFGFATTTLAAGWDETIALVERRAEELSDLANSQHPLFIGTGYNELDVPRHTCTVLGRLLKLTELILELETDEVPRIANDLTEDEVFSLMLHVRSLENWAYTARRMRALDEKDRIEIWNLQCAGQMGIPATAAIDVEDRGASFRMQDDTLIVLGDFDQGLHSAFLAFVSDNPGIQAVSLGSRGGSVGDAVRIARDIRKNGWDTVLYANCSSACSLAFLGGVERTIYSPYPQLGFHKVALPDGTAIPVDHSIYDQIAGFVTEMGVSPDWVLQTMKSAEPNEMAWPEVVGLCEPNVATFVQRLCY